MADSEWIQHRRNDGEIVGWIIPHGDQFVVADLLGRERSGPVDWLTAEETLEELGIGYLADIYMLTLDDETELQVRIAEISETSITVKQDDSGAVGAAQVYYSFELPAPATLRPLRT